MKKFVLSIFAVLLLFAQAAVAQNLRVSGTVTSQSGEPMPGVSVVLKGTTTGASTNAAGVYNLNAPANGELEFSFVGMKPQTLPVSSRTTVNVVMEDDATLINEVVVTGYGVTRKAAFTGSAQVIGSDVVSSKTDANFMKSLQGSVAGLQMFNVNGQPGAFASVNIRGVGSVNSGKEPLYIVDGMPMYSDKLSGLNPEGNGDAAVSPMASINPADIASVTVLKDATATAIYGARAANGVIVITTKRGETGEAKINFLAKKGFSRIGYLDPNYRTVNTEKYFDMWGKSFVNSGDAADYAAGLAMAEGLAARNFGWEKGVTPDTDWLKEILRIGQVEEYSFDVSGASKNTNYFISGGYYRNQGVIIGSDMNRYSGRANIETKAKYFTFGLLSSVSYSLNNNVATESQYINPIVSVYDLRPIQPVRNADGEFNLDANYNPVALRSKGGDINSQRSITANVNPYVSVDFGGGFIGKSSLGLNLFNLREYAFRSLRNPQGATANMSASLNDQSIFNATITNTLNWMRTFGRHNINLLVGQEAQSLSDEQTMAAASNFPFPSLPEMGNASTPTTAFTGLQKATLSSYFFNAQWDLADKYYLSGSLRYDGSSRFGANSRWGLFYSVGGKYRLSAENFMQGAKGWLDNLTFRASYGTVGNQDIGYYSSREFYRAGYDYKGKPGVRPNAVANPNLKWERKAKFNVGVDARIFNRFNIEVDYYNELTKDMIFAVPLSFTTGIRSVLQNVGEMRNSGVEALITANIISTKDFRWDMNFNITANKNEIVKLATDLPIESSLTIRKVGQAYNTFYMQKYAGVDPDNGRPQWYKGQEGDEKTYNYNEAGQRIVGKADPKVHGGFGTQFGYKGFDLALDFSYSYGGKVYNSGFRFDMQSGDYPLGPISNYVYENAWTPENRNTDVPRFVWGDSSNAVATSSRFLMDGSYLRLKSVNLGYTFKKEVLSKIKMQNLRVYVSADNLFTARSRNFIGFDPETRADGIQSWVYPTATNVMVGLQFGF